MHRKAASKFPYGLGYSDYPVTAPHVSLNHPFWHFSQQASCEPWGAATARKQPFQTCQLSLQLRALFTSIWSVCQGIYSLVRPVLGASRMHFHHTTTHSLPLVDQHLGRITRGS